MSTIIKIKNTSHQLLQNEKEIINYILSKYFQFKLKNNVGKYISLIDLDNISYKWCYDFIQNDSGVFGAWNPSFKNSVFLRPSVYNEQFNQYCENKDISQNELNLYQMQKKQYQDDFIKIKNNSITGLYQKSLNKQWVNDFDLFKSIEYMLSSENLLMISAVCHQLYHRHQFIDNPPLSQISYFLKYFIGVFIPYTKQCQLSWTLEGDVRVNVDNQQNQELQKLFDKVFMYLNSAGKAYKRKIILKSKKYKKYLDEQLINTLDEIQQQYNSYSTQFLNSDELKIVLQLMKKFDLLSESFLNFIENDK